MNPGTTKTLDDLKTWNKQLVDETLESWNTNGFTFNDQPYASNGTSQQKIINAATFALIAQSQGVDLPSSLGLRTQAVSKAAVQSTDVVALAAAMLTFLSANEDNANAHKDAIDALSLQQDLLDYDITTGWSGNDPFPPVEAKASDS